jgi:hypothetical protein
MGDIVGILGALIALLLFGLAMVIVIDRARMGWRRAENDKLGRRQRQQELSMRIEQAERAIAEQRPAIAAAQKQLAKLRAECDTLKEQLNRTEYPFGYTVVPMESRDMHARSWRFTARHPSLGADLPEVEPAGQWNQGRTYVIAAENQAEARSVMDRLLPRHRGFTVVNAGEAPPEAAPEQK